MVYSYEEMKAYKTRKDLSGTLLRRSTKQGLRGVGKHGESFTDIIDRLISERNDCTCVTSQEKPISVGDRLSKKKKRVRK